MHIVYIQVIPTYGNFLVCTSIKLNSTCIWSADISLFPFIKFVYTAIRNRSLVDICVYIFEKYVSSEASFVAESQLSTLALKLYQPTYLNKALQVHSTCTSFASWSLLEPSLFHSPNFLQLVCEVLQSLLCTKYSIRYCCQSLPSVFCLQWTVHYNILRSQRWQFWLHIVNL